MNQKLSDGIYYEDETMQAIVLWTMNGGQMVLCLPKDGYSAEEVLQSLTTEKLQKISGADYRCVQLSLPKFKLESNVFSDQRGSGSHGDSADAGNRRCTDRGSG